MAVQTPTRIDFLDNIRGFSILALVVLFHPAVPYSTIIAKHLDFYVVEPTSLFFDILALFFDIFLMPLLFLVAGFFGLPSLTKRSIKRYIGDKFVHIMIPFFLGVFLLNPYPNYIKARFKQETTVSYLTYLKDSYFGNLAEMFIHNKASVHLWFLSLLFLFYLLLALVYAIDSKWFEKCVKGKQLCLSFLTFFALIGALCFFLVNLFTPDYGQWYNFEIFWTFQATRLSLYLLYFFFGVFCYKNTVLKQGFSLPFWFVLALVLTPINLYVIIHFFGHLCDYWYLEALHALLHSFSCLALCLTLLELFRRGLNFSNWITRILSTNSYAIYILHFNFFIGIEYALCAADIPVIWKFLISGISAYLISLVISQGILKWIPILNLMLYGKRKL